MILSTKDISDYDTVMEGLSLKELELKSTTAPTPVPSKK